MIKEEEKQSFGKEVFFIGAGFTKAIDHQYPLISELTTKITEKFRCNDGAKHDNYLDLVRYFNNLPTAIKDDIEELFSYLIVDLPYRSEEQKYLNKKLFIELTKNLINAYPYVEDGDINYVGKIVDPKHPKHAVKHLFEYINNNKTPVISLNYDILFEKIMRKLGLILNGKAYYNSYGAFYPYIRKDYSGKEESHSEKHPFYKLHGSINWLHSGNLENIDSDIRYSATAKEVESAYTNGYTPFIVPPVVEKSNLYNNKFLKLLWEDAYNHLQEATTVYIIGYSLPITDKPIQYLFKDTVKQGATIYVVNKSVKSKKNQSGEDVIDTQASEDNLKVLKQRYENTFKDAKLNFDYCKVYSDPLPEFIVKEILNKNHKLASLT